LPGGLSLWLVYSIGVGFIAGLPERPGSQQRHFLHAPKDVFVCSVLICVLHIRGFMTMHYINVCFTYFTYLLLVFVFTLRDVSYIQQILMQYLKMN